MPARYIVIPHAMARRARFVSNGVGFRGLSWGLGLTNVTPTPGMVTVAQAIQTQEGYYPGSLAYTNNNPGNLMYAGQPGATKGSKGLAVFDSYDDGLQALYNQLAAYANQGMTISQMTAVYAPATNAQGQPIPGNNPSLYANNIANAAGTSTDASLSDVFAGSTVNPWNTTVPTDLGVTFSDLSSIDPTTLGIAALLGGIALYAAIS